MQSVPFEKVKSFLLHASDVVGERGGLITSLGGAEAEELRKSGAVLGVLVDTKLDVVLGLLGLEEVERSVLKDEKKSTEFELTFDEEVLNVKVVLPITRTY